MPKHGLTNSRGGTKRPIHKWLLEYQWCSNTGRGTQITHRHIFFFFVHVFVCIILMFFFPISPVIDWQPVQIDHFCPESKPLAFFALIYPSNPSNFPLQSCISNLNHNQSGKKVLHLVHIKQTYLSL